MTDTTSEEIIAFAARTPAEAFEAAAEWSRANPDATVLGTAWNEDALSDPPLLLRLIVAPE